MLCSILGLQTNTNLFNYLGVEYLSDTDFKKIKKELPVLVGKRITTIRKKVGLTQTQLANKTNKDRQYIYKIEKGKVTPNISTLFIICQALTISLKDFFDFEIQELEK